MTDQLDVIREKLAEIAQKDENSYFVCIDGFENIVLDDLKEKYPKRVIRCGISEQSALGLSAGLALSGKNVFLIIMGMYVSTRAFEQLRLDIAYNSANVTVIAMKTGIRHNVGAGYSHYAIEDIALVRALPNMRILSPATCDELSYHLDYAQKYNGPIYLRVENLHSDFNKKAELNIERLQSFGKGKDAAIIAMGAMVEYACSIMEPLKNAGINVQVINASMLKPFDEKIILELIKKRIPIVTMEEQTSGGLGSIVAEIVAKTGKSAKFLPIKIENETYNIVGDYQYMMNILMDFDNIPHKIIKFVNKKYSLLGIPIIIVKSKLNKKMKGKYTYCLFGIIPLLKVKQRFAFKPNKHPFRAYLFGLIRIL